MGAAAEPNPQGKIIGTIFVVNEEVFSRRDWRFQWLNIFHRTTRQQIVRRELLMKPGELYDQSLVDETTRNLQSPPPMVVGGRLLYVPEWASVITIVPVRSGRPGYVDLVVVTRDVWSLRFNTDFEFQQDTLAYLATSLSENNLFGWRKYLAANFVMDQGVMSFGPTYFDPNIMGSRLTLYARASAYYARQDGEYEGNSETFSLRYPLYALSRRWGGGVDVIHHDLVIRRFRGNNLWLEDIAATRQTAEAIPHIYRRRDLVVEPHVVRSFPGSPGATVVQRVTFGHLFSRRGVSALPGVQPDPTEAQLFLAQYAPVPEDRSEPYLRYEAFTARYGVFRDLDTFDLRENRRLGPSISARVGYGIPALGADFRALALSATVACAGEWRGGYGAVELTGSMRVRDAGQVIDQFVQWQVFSASPIFAGAFRLFVYGEVDGVRKDSQKTQFFLGGRTGMRGYAIGDFKGPVQAVGHVEVRTLPLHVWSQRFGALLFYDVGHAADSLHQLHAFHDIGIGMRHLIPQLNASVFRLDWAFATEASDFTRAGWPGRLTAGFQQVF